MSGREEQSGPTPSASADHPREDGARPGAPREKQAPSPFASFVRYAVCGGGVTLLSSWALLLLLDTGMGLAVSNALVTVLGTLLVNELHGRVSFRSERRGWRMHAESALTALGAYLITTGAMLALRHLAADPAPLLQQCVYLAASSFAGTCRFLVLRLVVFGRRGHRGGGRSTVILAA